MKLSACFSFLLLLSSYVFTQILNDSKRDAQWITGEWGYSPPTSSVGLTIWKFGNQITFDTAYPSPGLELILGHSSICDTSGQLILASNGTKVCDQNGNIITCGDSLSFGFFSLHYPSLRIPDGTVILPLPGYDSIYIVLHQRLNHFPPDTFPQQIWKGELLYSVVSATDNRKIVLSKNNRIIQDTLATGFEITRHANGRDWWIIQPATYDSKFYKVLITPAGIYSVETQYTQSLFGELSTESGGCFSQTFSNHGNIYVACFFERFAGFFPTSGGIITIRVFDFDRCTGELSNERVFRDTLINKSVTLRCGISPGSRYLYLNCIYWTDPPVYKSHLFQFDLNHQFFGNTMQLIAEDDGFIDSATCNGHRPPLFYDMRVGYDDKIYIDGFSSRWIHVIEHPDNPGLSCGFIQRKILLPTYTGGSLPHFPNYRLGPVSGSVCDSLTAGIEVLKPAKTVFSVFPNPVADHLQVSWDKPSGGECGYYLINSLGAVIQAASFRLSGQNYTISLSEVPEGMYLLRLFSSAGEAQTLKLVVLRP